MKKKAWSRRTIDRLENGIIVLLVCSALFLVYQSGLVQNFAGQGAGTSGESVFTGVQNTALSRGTPVRLMVQLDDGRYGAQYDQTLVDQLYASGLSELLTDSIEAMETPRTVTQEVWQQAIAQSGPWVFTTFCITSPSPLRAARGGRPASSFSPPGGAGQMWSTTTTRRRGLLRRADSGRHPHPAGLPGWAAAQRRAVRLRGAGTGPGAGALWHPPGPAPHHHGVHRRQPRGLLGEEERTALLDALDFNTRALTIYESADGTVMQEGSDTLRIQEEGKIIYHASDSGQARFQALSQREKDLQIKAEEVLDLVTAGQLGEGRMFCQSIETLEDETVELTFCYLLDGAQVQLGEEGWGPSSSFPTAPSPPLPSACAPTPPPTGPSGPCRSGRRPPR